VTSAHIPALLLLLAVGLGDRAARADAGADTCMTAAERGQTLRKQEKLAASRALFQECARTECPAFVRSDCTRWLGEVQNAEPSLVIRVVDEHASDVRDARVEMDGAPVLDRTDGSALPVDPGTHAVRVTRGAVHVEQSVLVREGEHDRLVIVRLPAGEAVAPPPRSYAAVPLATWIFGGIALGAVSAATSLWVVGLHERSDLEGSCAPSHLCTQSQVDGSRGKLVAGDVAMGVGLAAAGASLWFALAARSQQSRVGVGVSALPRGASLGVVMTY
jgi:hypothetical protein